MTDKFIYDEVPYPSFTFPQTHPDRLATLAKMYGMNPADPEKCELLELGCGDGTNLISFAYSLPQSRFVGIDLSAHHINAAKEAADQLGLTNIHFQQADVTELSSDKLGKFDFIVAHGLYSWVPVFVRNAILKIYSDCLAENGVGYISYNAYPGCHLRQICFASLQYSTTNINDPMERVRAGIENLRSFAEAAQPESLVQSILSLEYDQMLEANSKNVFHDEFSPINQPFYFHEFASQIGQFNFQFLAEADPTTTNEGKLSEKGKMLLKTVANDIIRREQYFDFIRFTRFRRTLFCRNSVMLVHDLDPSSLDGLLIASQLKLESDDADLTDESPVKFSDSKGASVTINHPLTKTALNYLINRCSRRVGLDELILASSKLLGTSVVDAESRNRTAFFLINLFKAGMVKFHTYEPDYADVASEFPEVTAFARWQIENGSESVATLLGSNLDVKNMMLRAMIVLLDGTRNREDIANQLKELLEVPNEQREEFEVQLVPMIESNLKHMAEMGLLVA